MKIGIVRKFDELGRIVIPKEFRKALGWNEGTQVEIFADENGVNLKTHGADLEKEKVINELYKAQAAKNINDAHDALRHAIAYLEK